MTRALTRISGFAEDANDTETQEFPRAGYGQSCPQHYLESGYDLLGPPLSIREVAGLIGCSAWTVRQRYVPQGLPHLRSGPSGKLIFYRDQVVRWIVNQQQKGEKS